jgi:hypothetical protein
MVYSALVGEICDLAGEAAEVVVEPETGGEGQE